jgi:tRNA (guanine-N7-)-methyltransferase
MQDEPPMTAPARTDHAAMLPPRMASSESPHPVPHDPERERPRHGDVNPRMHAGGKLSFRSRVQDGADEPGDRLVLGGKNPPALHELAPRGYRDVEIEIGPGKGAFVLAATAAKPDTFLLGIEAAVGYASLGATRLFATGRTNGLFLVDNGKLYLQDRVGDGELAAVHVYFPDPWPKRRHARRRFFTPDVVPVLARALRDGGCVYAATDNAAYAGQIARVLGSARDFVRDEHEEQRVVELGEGHAFTPTNFERKYVEQGRVIRRYAFRRLPR